MALPPLSVIASSLARPINSRLKNTLLIAALATQASLTAAAEPVAVQEQLRQAHHFDIPAQPLRSALVSFAQQSGIQISVDNGLIEGLNSSNIQGHQSAAQALQALLADSPLQWRMNAGNSLTLEARPKHAHQAESGPLDTPDMIVTASSPLQQGTTHFDSTYIARMPTGNGDITSLLKAHPNVQFNDNQLSSKTPGEIDPADISINGAKYWQNAFLVDGVNMNNDIDPVASNPVHMSDVPGRSQGLALDTDLLDSLTVHDSNVSAAYGGFNGGVVEAHTRKPSQELRGKVSMQMTRSEWTNYHIDEREEEGFKNSTNEDNQPEFEKLITRATLEGHLTENFGLLGSFSRKTSEIPIKTYSSKTYSNPAEGIEKEQTRQIDNYFVKASWQIFDNLDADLTLTHAPQVNRYFIENSKDSAMDIVSGGDMASLKVKWTTDFARLTNTLSWSRMENSRESETDYQKSWRWSETKSWSSSTPSKVLASEGGWGDVDQKQTSLGFKLDVDWNAFDLLGTQHLVKTGLELNKQSAYYERLEQMQYGSVLRGSTGCNETEWCSVGYTPNFPSAAQGFTRLNTYDAGKIEIDSKSWAFYIQDEITLGRLTLRPGLRLDGDDYMDKETFAPRFALEYDVFGNGQTRLIGGANRYYGRNLFAYRLYDGRATLQSYRSRATVLSPWGATTRTVNNSKFNQLDIPYDDELTLGLSHTQWNTEFAFKYINRKGRDQIIRTQGRYLDQPSNDPTELQLSYRTYTNQGKSESDIYTLTVTPTRGFNFFGTQNNGQLAVDWTDVSSSNTDYATELSEVMLEDPFIQYEGKFIRSSERPAANFNRPWTLRLTTITEVPALNLAWSNFLRYRDGYRRIADTGENVVYQGETVDVWAETAYGAAVVWDTRLSWELPITSTQAAFVNLDVSNVLDKQIVSNVNGSDVPTYEVGRQFMVEVGYRF